MEISVIYRKVSEIANVNKKYKIKGETFNHYTGLSIFDLRYENKDRNQALYLDLKISRWPYKNK